MNAPVDVKALVNGYRQAWCDEKMEQFFGESIYEHPTYKVTIPNGAMVTVIGEGFQIAINASMEDWQWTKIGDVSVGMHTTFNA